MNGQQVLERLIDICEKLDLPVRLEPMASSGGVCELRGRKTLFVGTACSAQEQISTFCEALMKENLERVYILPEIREIIENEFVRIRSQKPEGLN